MQEDIQKRQVKGGLQSKLESRLHNCDDDDEHDDDA